MSENKHIIIVEDEAIIAMDIQHCLVDFGYVVDEVATTTDEAMFYIEKYLPNLVLMDIKLNDSADGTTIVDLIQTKFNIPVVYLTSFTDNETLKKAQSTKPYGYVVKPVDEKQLNSAILIALSRFEEEENSNNGEVIQLNSEYEYALKEKNLYHLNEKVNLTKKEGEFFFFMVSNRNKAVHYNKIIKELWDNDDVPTSTLRSLVRRVRDKLNDDLIENVSSEGYRIIAK